MWETGFTLDHARRARRRMGETRRRPRRRSTLPVLAVQGTADYFMGPDTLRAWIDTLPGTRRSARSSGSRHAVLNDSERGRRHRHRARCGARPEPPSPLPHGCGADQDRLTAPGRRCRAARAPTRIILVMTDEQRHDWVGYGGDSAIETPVLDRLAAAGVIFDQGYSAATTCVPWLARRCSPGSTSPTPPAGPTGSSRSGRASGRSPASCAMPATRRHMVGGMHFTPIDADHGFETMRMCENINPGSGYGDDDVDDYRRWLAEPGPARLADPEARTRRAGTPARSTSPFPAPSRTTPRTTRPCGSNGRRSKVAPPSVPPTEPLFLIVSFPHPHVPLTTRPSPTTCRCTTRPTPCSPSTGSRRPTSCTARSARSSTGRGPLGGRLRRGHRLLVGPHRGSGAWSARSTMPSGGSSTSWTWPRSFLFFTSDHGDYGGNRGSSRRSRGSRTRTSSGCPWSSPAARSDRPPGRRSSALVQSASFAATCLDYAGIDAPRRRLRLPQPATAARSPR